MNERSRVFLSYTYQDSDVAERFMHGLVGAGISAYDYRLVLEPGTSISSTIRSELSPNDYLVILLSPAMLDSQWVEQELEYAVNTDWKQRAITLVPVKIQPCEVPNYLMTWSLIDATKKLDTSIIKLVSLLRAAPLVQFAKLSPIEFERFVGDLLRAYNFRSVNQVAISRDYGFDFTARSEYRDPFGRTETIEWLIQVKALKHGPDVNSLHAFLGALSLRKEAARGLFITSGQLTSPAREWLDRMERTGGPKISVIEGNELRLLTLSKEKLIRKYFGSLGDS